MELDLYRVDAFTNRVFGGNPACVMPLDEWLDDDLLLKLAQEKKASLCHNVLVTFQIHQTWWKQWGAI